MITKHRASPDDEDVEVWWDEEEQILVARFSDVSTLETTLATGGWYRIFEDTLILTGPSANSWGEELRRGGFIFREEAKA